MPAVCPKCNAYNSDSAKFCAECGCIIEKNERQYSNIVEEGTLLVNRYKIIRLVKSGGMGAVYCAEDRNLGKTCAIKELLSFPHSTEKERLYAIDKFQSEAKTLANLHHISLPRVYDYFTIGDRYYLTMDFIEGKDLLAVLKERGNPGLPEKDVIKWAIEICDVLSYLHSRSPVILYRDLKPSNIMLRKSDEKVILIDFGIAKAIQDDTNPKTAIGTMGYISPEQFRGMAEAASDIYSLGSTMSHLLTGVMPIPFTYEPVKKRIPELSDDIELIIKKTLDIKPENRFSSAEEMKKSLLSIIEEKIPSISSQSLSEIDLAIIQLNATSPKARLEAITKLSNVNDERIVSPLTDILSDSNSTIRKEAVTILGKIQHPSSVDHLIKMLNDKDLNVRIASLTALGTPKCSKAFPYLVAALKDEDYRIRKHASLALGEIGDERAIEPLRQARQKEGLLSFGMRMTIDKAIQKVEIMKSAVTREEKYSTNELLPEVTVRFHEAKNHNDRGQEYFKEHKYEKSINEFNKALEINPTYVEAHFNIARVILTQIEINPEFKNDDRINEALLHFNKCIELASDSTISAEAKKYIDNLTEEWNKLESMRKDASGVITEPSEEREKTEIEEETEEELEEETEEVKIAETITLKSPQERVNYYKDMLKGSPEDPVIYNELGLAYNDYGNVFLAENNYRKSLDLAPNYAEAHFNLAILYKELGFSLKDDKKINDSLVHFEHAFKLSNDDDIVSKSRKNIDEIKDNLSKIEVKSDESEREEFISEKVEYDLPSEEPHEIEVKINTLCPGSPQERIIYYQEMLKSSPYDPLLYNQLGLAYNDYGNVFLAETNYRKAIEFGPDNGEIHFNIALLYKELGFSLKDDNKLNASLTHFEATLKLTHDEDMKVKARKNIEEIKSRPDKIEISEKREEIIAPVEVIEDKHKTKEIIPEIHKEPEKKDKIPEEYYKELIEKNPEDPVNYNKLGLVYYEKKDIPEAQKYYEKALKCDKNYSEANFNLGLLYRDKKNILKALRHLKLCVKMSGDETLKKKARDYIKEIEEFEEKQEKMREETVSPAEPAKKSDAGKTKDIKPLKISRETRELTLKEAEVVLKENKQILDFLKVLSEKPDDLQSNIAIARLYKEEGNLLKALDYYKKISSIEPNNAQIYLDMALIYMEQKQYSEALENLKICARKANNSELLSEAKNYISHIEELSSEAVGTGDEVELEDRDKEIRKYEDMLHDNPDKAEIHIKLGTLYKDAADFDKAIFHYKEYLNVNKKDDRTHFELAMIYRDKGNIFNALKYLRLCVNLTEDDNLKRKAEEYISMIEGASPQEKKKTIYREEKKKTERKGGKEEEFIKELKKELKEKPDDTNLLGKLGQAYYKAGQMELSLESYLKMLNIDPSDSKIHFNIGLAYKEQGKIVKSLIHFKKYIMLAPAGEYIEEAKNYIKELE
ncbi:MAG: tetratricopeptide repeat protein [Candidatus Eremiobacterota bacterium]